MRAIPAWIVRLASIAITLAVWEWYGRDVDPIFMSHPSAIVLAVFVLIIDGVVTLVERRLLVWRPVAETHG